MSRFARHDNVISSYWRMGGLARTARQPAHSLPDHVISSEARYLLAVTDWLIY